jgi:F0F1-type ATP synthase alpha subunit
LPLPTWKYFHHSDLQNHECLLIIHLDDPLYAGSILDLAPEDVSRFEEELIQHIKDHQGELLEDIRDSGDLSDENTSKLEEAIGSFKTTFRASAG